MGRPANTKRPEDTALKTALKRYAILSSLAFLMAGGLAFFVAIASAKRIETRTVDIVQFAMRENGLNWVQVSADGLRLILEGTAPSEAARFRANSQALSLVDGDRVVDLLDVVDAASFAAPPFALEMLRNEDGISLIGLVPSDAHAEIADAVPELSEDTEVVDLIEDADYPVPEGWSEAVDYGLRALATLSRAKVSVTPGRVEVEAVSRSPEERAEFVEALERRVPDGVELILDISAPRPVITPFALRFVRSADGARLETCSADTPEDRDRILAAARDAGLTGEAACQIGLGIPSPQWARAVEQTLAATAEIGETTVTFTDADISLVAAETADPEVFDRIIGALEADLPEVFSLTAILTEPASPDANTGPPSFIATLDGEGLVELSGRLPDERIEAAVGAFAEAAFGSGNVRLVTRQVEDLPAGWTVRVLAGLSALQQLNNGTVRIEPDQLDIRGQTGSTSAVSDIARLLGDRLGSTAQFDIDVDYIEALDPASSIPTAENCVGFVADILAETKITFDPGSVEINESAGAVLDRLAEVLPDCRHVAMEIGGHTDAQGRETMNLRLSQGRADAVLNGLLARNVLTTNLTAQGYGESRPIADNDTETGRETNRRIEFRLMTDIQTELVVAAEIAAVEAAANLPRPTPRPGPDPEPEGTAPEEDAEPADAAEESQDDTDTPETGDAAEEEDTE